ncbi:MAG: monofunctional biosynthetic peptidoglycan transglycosylase [Cytophagales bacterium]|nr:monofunctional biosynthetic peptidoglycan transglycosylase [Cytophagales bacterium]
MKRKTASPKKNTKSSASNIDKKVKNFIFFILKSLMVAAIVFMVLSVSAVYTYKYVDPPFTLLMAKRKMKALYLGNAHRIHYEFIPIHKMSVYMPLAVVASEDQLFPHHNGFDIVSIAKAIEHNRHAKRKHGASTISQQVAKNVFLWDGKNFVRKVLEVYFTFLIENIWGKKRIMEVYLNVAEMGERIFGVEMCAQKLFHKKAKQLTESECALIAASLPNPMIFSADKPTKYMYKRQSWIVGQMHTLTLAYINEVVR